MDRNFTIVSHRSVELYDEKILHGIEGARQYVLVATANVKNVMVKHRGRFQSIIQTFAALCRQGVDVKILFAQKPSGPFLQEIRRHPELERENFDMRHCARNHMKLVVIDGRTLYFGSANLTGAGIGLRGAGKRNFEVGLLSGEPGLVRDIEEIFFDIWEGRQCRACLLQKQCPLPINKIE